MGDTPINNLRLPAGKHALRITNPDLHIDQTMPITLEPGQALTLNLEAPPP